MGGNKQIAPSESTALFLLDRPPKLPSEHLRGFERTSVPLFDVLHPTAITQMSWVLARKGTVLGMHPEGTRNKGHDPYTFLRAKPGVGYLIRDAHPDTLIVPFFLNGITEDLLGEIRRNLKHEGQRGDNVRFWFGEPIRMGDLDRSKPARELGEEVLAVAHELGLRDPAEQVGERERLEPDEAITA